MPNLLKARPRIGTMKMMLFFVFSIGLLCSMENQELNAQTGATASPSGKTFVGWNTAATPFTTITGIIQKPGSTTSSRCSAGSCASLATPQGNVLVLLGSYQKKALQDVVVLGSSMQASGQIQDVDGQKLLIAKQIVVGGKTIAIRNDHGFLIHERTGTRVHTQTLQNGGN
jgi:hypothetical protein